ncbi:MAG: biotin-dependent carboxyltransferase family protein, partial [Pseudomonadota bacterium]
YSYVHLSGGLRTEAVLGSRSAHLIAGIGRPLAAGDRIPFEVTALGPALTLTAPESRFEGGPLRVLPTPQTALFPPEEQARFEATTFTRDRRGNRQGVRLAMEDAGFATEGQLSLLSDFILPGDVQMTGDGVPYILGPECQTTGGYPRIGTVIAADLPRALQAPPGASLSFQFVTQTQALAARPDAPAVTPLIRDPATMSDLLSYQLIDGVQSARD